MSPDAHRTEIEPDDDGRVAALLASLDGAHFELVDPPADLWARIAARVAADHDQLVVATSVVEYSIDADDCVVTVDDGWAAFARENNAAALAAPPRRPIWDSFQTAEVRDLWRLLIERVRATQTPAQVPIRCDAPDLRRRYEMTVTPGADGAVHFRNVLTFEEPRTEVVFLSDDAERDASAPPVPVCSWCGDGHDGSVWRSIEELVRELRLLEGPMPAIDYGICPGCREVMSSDLMVRATRSSHDAAG